MRSRLDGGVLMPIAADTRRGRAPTPTRAPTVITVTYNSERDIRACLGGLAGLNVVVVDNASTDSTRAIVAAEFPEVTLHAMRENVGLSRAFNHAWRELADGDVFLVNPDVTATTAGLLRLRDALVALPHAALVGPRLVYPDGSTQQSARSFPSLWNGLARRTALGRTPWGQRALNKHLVSPYPDKSLWMSVDWLLGAAMLIRRDALEDLGGFDENYFLYCEDADFCARAWQGGYQVVYCTNVTFQHEYQRASRHTLDLTSRATRAHWRSICRLAASYPKQYFGATELRPQTVTLPLTLADEYASR